MVHRNGSGSRNSSPFRLLKEFLSAALLIASALMSGRAVGETIILSTSNAVPTAYMVDGVPTGRLVDIVVEAFRRAGRPVEIRLAPLARSVSQARYGEVDGVFALFRTAEREAFLTYSDEPLMREPQAFFVRTGSPIVFDGDLGRIAQYRVGVINGASHGPVLNRALDGGTFPSVERVANLDSLLRMLVAGRLDVVTSSREAVWVTAQALQVQGDIRELAPAVGEEPSFMAFTQARDMSAVNRDFSKALKSMKDDGTFDQISARYSR